MVHPTQRAIYDSQAEGWAVLKATTTDAEEREYASAAWEEWQRLWLEANGVAQPLALPAVDVDLPRCEHGSIACPECHNGEPVPPQPLDRGAEATA